MELREIIQVLLKNSKALILITLLGTLGGLIVFFLPTRYVAKGSFYAKRAANEATSEFFTYEGYYGQQAALSYTNTVIGLLESTDLMKMALEKLNEPVNEITLRKYKKLVNVKKKGPQLVTLETKGQDQSSAKLLWDALSDSLFETAVKINVNGDPALSFSKISEDPVVNRNYKNIWINMLAGTGVGFAFGLFAVSIKEYMKGSKK